MIKTPKQLGYRFPAEWEPQAATWFSWPHNLDTWPGKFEPIPDVFTGIVKTLAPYQHVNINVTGDVDARADVATRLLQANIDSSRVTLHNIPTNDAWCRDHGPAFVINPDLPEPLAVIDWGYNAWGGKYPPLIPDDIVPSRIAEARNLPVFYPGIVMEGGSIDVNGEGCLLTSKSCLLNENRNPALTQTEIEEFLVEYYNVEKILWLDEGIVGDDTDGHIDDTARFVSPTTIVAAIEHDPADGNYPHSPGQSFSAENHDRCAGKPFRVVEMPMPSPLFYNDQRLPASYANFLVGNGVVMVPTFRDKNDSARNRNPSTRIPGSHVVGIDCVDLAWGWERFTASANRSRL